MTKCFVCVIAAASLLAAGCNRAKPAGRAGEAHALDLGNIGSPSAPVIVELFQSQGCSSCPPANANINSIADRPGILALSFAVTYWDQLGWKDTFAKPGFTQRQWDYARFSHRGGVSTPQVIVNGGSPIVGSDPEELARTIRARGAAHGGPTISGDGQRVVIGGQRSTGKSTVWLVRYDPQVRNVPIRAGENLGRTLPHRDIVRELTELGTWDGEPRTFSLPAAKEPRLSTAVLVQQGRGGPVISASKL